MTTSLFFHLNLQHFTDITSWCSFRVGCSW